MSVWSIKWVTSITEWIHSNWSQIHFCQKKEVYSSSPLQIYFIQTKSWPFFMLGLWWALSTIYNSKDVSMRTFHKRVISGWWGRNLKVRRIEKKSLLFHMTSLPGIPIYTKLFPIPVNSGKYSSYLLSNQIDIQLYA